MLDDYKNLKQYMYYCNKFIVIFENVENDVELNDNKEIQKEYSNVVLLGIDVVDVVIDKVVGFN